MLLRLLPITPVLLVAAALPTPAAAAVQHDYAVHIDVTTKYDNTQSEAGAGMTRSSSTRLSTRLVADGSIVFHDGKLWFNQKLPVTETTTGEAESIYRDDWRHTDSACTAKTRPNPTGHALIEPDLLAPLTGDERLAIRITDGLEVEWDCTEIDSFASFGDGGFLIREEMGEGATDVAFNMPKEAIGQGKIIQLVSGPPVTGFCPDEDESTTSCTFTWEGQITLTKTATRTVDWGSGPTDDGDDLIAPLVPAKPPVTPPIDEGDDLIAPLVPPKKASVDAKGKTVSFRAGCASGCTGTAVLTTSGARAAAARKPLATLRFKVAAGRARTVRLTLPRKARSALRRAGRGTLAVTLRPKGGKAVRAKLALRLKRR